MRIAPEGATFECQCDRTSSGWYYSKSAQGCFWGEKIESPPLDPVKVKVSKKEMYDELVAAGKITPESEAEKSDASAEAAASDGKEQKKQLLTEQSGSAAASTETESEKEM